MVIRLHSCDVYDGSRNILLYAIFKKISVQQKVGLFIYIFSEQPLILLYWFLCL